MHKRECSILQEIGGRVVG